MNRITSAIVLALLAVGVTLLAQGPRRDGRWEVKIEMQMAGMTMPAQTTTQCLTVAEANDPQKAMPADGRGNNSSDCKRDKPYCASSPSISKVILPCYKD